MITIFAPTGIGEVSGETDLSGAILAAVQSDDSGPLVDGDIVVVTSKIISKSEGRTASVHDHRAVVAAETAETVARRGETRIVRTHGGLTVAGAGVDNSNVELGTVLALPLDADISAARLRGELERRAGVRLGVIISDTAGRAWRIGQTDQAIGAAGVRVVERFAGRHDRYGNELRVTAVAVADELAAAADLVKGKLADCPVAVIRGLGHHLLAAGDELTDGVAADLVREPGLDLFRYGTREAVIAAVLDAVGAFGHFEVVLELDDDALVAAVVSLSGRRGAEADLLSSIIRAGLPGRPH